MKVEGKYGNRIYLICMKIDRNEPNLIYLNGINFRKD